MSVKIWKQREEQQSEERKYRMKKIKLGVLGLGRIGKMHVDNILTMPEYEITVGCDPYLSDELAESLVAKGIGRCTKDPDEVFNDPKVEAVIICSATATHADFIIRAARAGKDVFCEKPIDHDVDRIVEAIKAVKAAGVILQVGFMHRYDRHHGAIADMVHEGKIGKLEVLKIVERDPMPPSMDYIRVSGGIYVDFMIHDLDMARYITQSEAVSVFATGTSVCDPEIGELGDFGSGHAFVKFANGALAVLETSRRSTFGNDQRIEVLGSKGMAIDDNEFNNNVRFFAEDGCHMSKSPWHFQERYKEAFFNELKVFAEAVRTRTEIAANGFDGLQAVLIAEAAAKSAKSGRMEPVRTIEI